MGDDLFSAYMNLESSDTLNSSGTEDKREDSRASGRRSNGAESSENEAENSVGEPVASHHSRSISMDSFMGKLNFGDELLKVPPSPGPHLGHHSRSCSMDGVTNGFTLQFGNGEFTGAELKKIVASEKLAEIAVVDPKKAKRYIYVSKPYYIKLDALYKLLYWEFVRRLS